jgi:outer membrane biosynthesis protein TonB
LKKKQKQKRIEKTKNKRRQSWGEKCKTQKNGKKNQNKCGKKKEKNKKKYKTKIMNKQKTQNKKIIIKKKSMLRGESSTTFPATFRISVNWHYKIRPLFLPKTTITIIKTCLM